ncbi:uncharacterized protein LOC117669204 isoform X2 [Pantherophis guttatus]|uniref:Uncharacterized protein LOC117669204 isoform X2 n=1 Tax=Pantherophis guttatus TaxID=94885 RepID=A0ABM3ZMV5_PANGU|nr:uncharacterized protein LOC117669204 isoform X2 [Pantherophis guttatus]
MWGVGFSLALAAFLQVELGIAAAESGVSQPPQSDPPFAWDETLPEMMVNWTNDAPEPAPPACHGGEDCPPWSSCEEDHVGRQICRCGLGYHLHPVFGCVPVKVFAAQLTVCNLEPPESSSLLVARQVQRLFQCLLGHLDGYLDSLIHALNRSGQEVTILHHFSAWGPVTSHKVDMAVDAFRVQCHSSLQGTPFCDHEGAYKALNLCQLNVCDPFSTTCSSPDGLVGCTCHPGFFRAHAMDRTCTACESGFWLQNGTCIRRAPPAQETLVALPLPLRSRVLSLPRVQPPGSMPELEDCPPFVLDPESWLSRTTSEALEGPSINQNRVGRDLGGCLVQPPAQAGELYNITEGQSWKGPWRSSSPAPCSRAARWVYYLPFRPGMSILFNFKTCGLPPPPEFPSQQFCSLC